MSLKARIEAVIYAAEEPVTLAQLASIFRDEALVSRAARSAPQPDPEAPAEDSADSLLAELAPESIDNPAPEPPATESLTLEAPPIPSAQEEPPPAADDPISELAASPVTDSFPEGVAPMAATAEPAATEGATTEAVSDPPASGQSEVSVEDEKKAARARDREVREEIRRLIDELIAEYSASDRGVEIREVAGGFRMATRAEYHDAVRSFVKSLKPPMKLSLQALESLAVIAYKQPITAPEIGDIRGVDSAGVLGSLIARKLVTTAGRKQVIGRPILYKTTKEFLLRFGLKDLNELPSIEEFEKMASELAENEEAASAPAEELPFAQNEIAEVEEALEEEAGSEPLSGQEAEGSSPSGQDSARDAAAELPTGEGPRDPKEPAPPMDEPPGDVPEPPIGEPPAEPDPAPTTEHDASLGEQP